MDLKDTLNKTRAYIERRNTEIIEAKAKTLEDIGTLENRIRGNFGEEIINAVEILTLCKNNGIPISITTKTKDICFVENDVYTNTYYLQNLLPSALCTKFKDPTDINLLTKDGKLAETNKYTKFPYSIYATNILISVDDERKIKFAYIGDDVNKLHFENLYMFKENCIEFLENFDKSIREIIH